MFNNKSITVKKIDNGYVVEAWCDGKEQAEYVKKISKIPSILARWFSESNKSPEEYNNLSREETEEDMEEDGVKVKIVLKNGNKEA